MQRFYETKELLNSIFQKAFITKLITHMNVTWNLFRKPHVCNAMVCPRSRRHRRLRCRAERVRWDQVAHQVKTSNYESSLSLIAFGPCIIILWIIISLDSLWQKCPIVFLRSPHNYLQNYHYYYQDNSAILPKSDENFFFLKKFHLPHSNSHSNGLDNADSYH